MREIIRITASGDLQEPVSVFAFLSESGSRSCIIWTNLSGHSWRGLLEATSNTSRREIVPVGNVF